MDEAGHRMSRRRAARVGIAALALMLAVGAPVRAEEREPALVAIGTGGKTGVYYLAGGAICRFVNERRWRTGLRCLAESSDGSIENLEEVRSGARAFGLAQSDWQHHAATGTGVFAEAGPDRELRSVFGLYPEAFTVAARRDSGIHGFDDLRGKRVSLGPAGSGGRGTMGEVMRAVGWTDADFAYVADLPMPDTTRALCGGEIDAAVFIVAHPNLTVEDMISSCGATLVPVAGPAIDALVAENGYYARYELPAGVYGGQVSAVPSFALTATLVTSSRVSPATVYELTKAVFDNFDAFRAIHPAFAGLDPARMASEGLTAPLHEGALRYFREAGLR